MPRLAPDQTAKLTDQIERTAAVCADVDAVEGGNAPLIAATETAERELRSLRNRLTGVRGLIAGEQECDEPPDEAGLCFRCGLQIAPRMEPHNPGCFGGRLAVAIGRPLVRAARFVRLARRELRP